MKKMQKKQMQKASLSEQMGSAYAPLHGGSDYCIGHNFWIINEAWD